MNVIQNMKNYIFKNDLLFSIFKIEMDLPLSSLPLDIFRLILLFSKINVIKIISSTNKSLHLLCSERNLWLERFKEKNLVIIDNHIKSVDQYMNEYKKVSYSSHTASHVVDMIINTMNTHRHLYQSMCFFNKFFSVDDIKNILENDHCLLTKIKEDNIKGSINISIQIGEEGFINYEHCDEFGNIKYLLRQKDVNVKYITSIINNIFYYFPLIKLSDVDCLPLIISKILILEDNFSKSVKNEICNRRKYWDRCYAKYEELYF